MYETHNFPASHHTATSLILESCNQYQLTAIPTIGESQDFQSHHPSNCWCSPVSRLQLEKESSHYSGISLHDSIVLAGVQSLRWVPTIKVVAFLSKVSASNLRWESWLCRQRGGVGNLWEWQQKLGLNQPRIKFLSCQSMHADIVHRCLPYPTSSSLPPVGAINRWGDGADPQIYSINHDNSPNPTRPATYLSLSTFTPLQTRHSQRKTCKLFLSFSNGCPVTPCFHFFHQNLIVRIWEKPMRP